MILIKQFKQKFDKKKEENLKIAYECIHMEIKDIIKNIKYECENNIDKKRNFIFEHTICFEVFSYTKEQINSSFQIAIKTYEELLIKRQILSKFGQYDWCIENSI